MKIFLKKAFFFISIPLIISITLQFLSDIGLRKSCSFHYKEWNDIVSSKVNADILVVGSSRAWVHISPYVLDSAFQKNSYNIGLDGYNFLMQYYRFKLLLKYNKKPDYIIQSLDCNTLSRRKTLLNYQQFFPYMKESLIKEATAYYTGFDFKDFYIPLYKYRSDPKSLSLGLKSFFKKQEGCDTGKYKGFQASREEWDNVFEDFKGANPNGRKEVIDPVTLRMFDEYLSFCKANKINVIMIYTPEYYEVHKMIKNRDSIMDIYRKFSEKYHIHFIDYSHDSLCKSKSYFYNSQHMNVKGVNIFNKKLAEDLKKIIK